MRLIKKVFSQIKEKAGEFPLSFLLLFIFYVEELFGKIFSTPLKNFENFWGLCLGVCFARRRGHPHDVGEVFKKTRTWLMVSGKVE